MSLVIESVVVETRPRLKSRNVFIVTQNLEENGLTALVLMPNSIIISQQNTAISIRITKNIHFITESLSAMNVQQNLLSFRVNYKETSRNYSGSFRSEVIEFSNDSKLLKLKPDFEFLKNYHNFTIQCRNCSNEISSVIESFDRVLPLPSENCNPNDWFCHKATNAIDLEPKKSDLFYKLCNFKINSKHLLESSFYLDKSVLVCKRCLAWLGTCEEDSVFLWHCTVSFHSKDVNNRLESVSLNANLGLVNFKEVLLNMIDETIGIVCKILMECQVDSDATEYLMLWVLDRKLDVSVYKAQTNDCQNDEIELENVVAVKLLYKWARNGQNEVKKWQADVHVQSVAVALPMFSLGLAYLGDNAKLMTREIVKMSDGFIMSYVFCDL